MGLKKIILSNKEYNKEPDLLSHSIEFRAPVETYKKFYTTDQLIDLFTYGLLEDYKKCGDIWESPYTEYWQFTKKGRFFRIWFTTSKWVLFKIYVLKTHVWRYRYDVLMYKLFNKRANWMDYSKEYGGVDYE